ncbi:MAG: carboxymuconolactone decarboxylase family protein [Nitrospinota bacterium]|nr:carboxymuconolactone decarboxylase family protein [Nitrospinota bacterium]
MDVSKDQILPFVNSTPNVQERIDRAIKIRKSMGIYGKGGQSERGAWNFSPTHAQVIFEYCFGMVWGQPHLTLKEKEIIVISALAAQQLDEEVEWHVQSALNLGLEPEEVIGVITQLSPYIGLPKTNHAFRSMLKAFKKVGISKYINEKDSSNVSEDELEAERSGDRMLAQVDLNPDVQDRIEKAIEVRQKIGIYGDGGQGHDGFYTISPAHNQVIFEYCFGMVWNQSFLDLRTRELVVIAVSTANQCDNELEWHVRSALNAGLNRDEIIEAITQCSPYIGLSKTNQGLRVAKKAFDSLDEKSD